MKHNWGYKPFAEICITLTPTSKIGKSEYLSHGQYPIISQEDIYISGYWNDKKDITLHSSPVIIFGDHSRVLKYVDFEFVVGADGVKIIQPIGLLDAKFLYHFLRWYNVPSLGYSRHFKLLKEANYPVPPMETQEQIVAELDQINDLIAKNRELLSQLDALAQSLFYDTFGDPIANPKQWDMIKLDYLIQPKKCILRSSKVFTQKDSITYIDISSINRNSNSIDNPSTLIFSDAPSRAQQCVKHGDLLVSLVRPNLKNIALCCLNDNSLVASSGFCVLRSNKNSNPYYLLYLILSASVTEYLCSKISGAAYPAITENDIKTMLVPAPPVELQKAFSERIGEINIQKAKVEAEIAELQTLLDARMDYWFN